MLSLQYLTSSLRMRRTSSLFDMDQPNSSAISVDFLSMKDAASMAEIGASGASVSACGFGQQQQQHMASFYRTSKWLCYLTTCLAFMLGVGVGIALPILYASPYSVGNNNNNNISSVVALEPASWSTNPVNSTNRIQVHLRKKANQLDKKRTKLEKMEQPYSSSSDENGGLLVDVVSFVEPQLQANNNNIQEVEKEEPQATVSSEAVQGIFWSQAVEDILPRGFDEQDAKEWRDFSQQSQIIRIEEGCGRMQNRLITFENGRQSCCRYRQNFDQIQGEIFSFYLSRLLRLPNLPPSSLGLVKPLDPQWTNVQSSITQAQWTEDRPVVYTQFLEQLEPAFIPQQLRGRNRHLNPSDVQSHQLAKDADRLELITLAQWSDLLVLDYLTANLDRMVNNLYNMQWNPAMMDSPAHNLARDSRTGLLVFLDNESGLLHGYRLLDKYQVYHKSLLDSLCLFRKTTVDSLRQLREKNNVGTLLRQMFSSRDGKLLDYLPFLPEKSIKTLNYRIDQVLDQVSKCQSLYRS